MVLDDSNEEPLIPRSDGRFEGHHDCQVGLSASGCFGDSLRNERAEPPRPSDGRFGQTVMTVDEALCHIGIGRFQWWMLLVLGFSYMADAGEMLLLSFLGPDVKCEWGLTGTEESLLTTVVFVGMALGSFLFGTLADFFGRKPVTIVDIAFTGAAGLVSASASNFPLLVLFRFFVGVGIGGFVLVLSMYSEFLPVQDRGKTLSVYQVFWGVGACIEVMIAWVVMPRWQWRGLAVASAIPLVVLLLVLPFIPESPRFLIVSGQEDKALQVLKRIARVNNRPLPENVQLLAPIHKKTKREFGWKQFVNQFRTLFEYPLASVTRIVWPMWIAAALAYYSIVILTTSIQSDDDENECVGNHVAFSNEEYRNILIDASGEIPGVILAVFTIDILGRKKSLMYGWFACAAAMAALPIASALQTALMFAGRLFIMFLFTVVLVMIPELYPSSCRSFAMGTGNLMSRFGGGIAPFLAQALYDSYGLNVAAIVHGILFFLAGIAVLLVPFETSGRPLPDTVEDLQDMLERPQKNDRNGHVHNGEPTHFLDSV